MRKVTVAETGVEPGSFNNNSQALLQDIQLENLLTYFYLSSRGLDIYSYKEIREVNVQILESIQKEIK
ncbi:MAG: hypothetical protein IPJ74_14275 [Saprospiraceae bacterium]|nr:hypothetical protein [Saprospiraceae bacterium]